MRLILSTALFACLIWAASEHAARLAAETACDDAQSDNAALAAQLDEADAKAKEHDRLVAVTAKLGAESVASQKTTEDLKQQLATAATEAQQLTAERDAAQKELRDAKKAALLEARNSCPPPEVIPKETQKQEFAPVFEKPDGSRTWRTDFAWDESKAKDMKRLQFVVWATRSCPHCDWALTQCSDQEIGAYAFKNYVPAWITVQDAETHDLAERFGVNKFRYPAAMLRDPNTGKFVLWRPSKDNAEFRKQLETEKETLTKESR